MLNDALATSGDVCPTVFPRHGEQQALGQATLNEKNGRISKGKLPIFRPGFGTPSKKVRCVSMRRQPRRKRINPEHTRLST